MFPVNWRQCQKGMFVSSSTLLCSTYSCYISFDLGSEIEVQFGRFNYVSECAVGDLHVQGERQEEQAHHDPQLWHRASHHYFRQPEEGAVIHIFFSSE
jgi:hypothetical protein